MSASKWCHRASPPNAPIPPSNTVPLRLKETFKAEVKRILLELLSRDPEVKELLTSTRKWVPIFNAPSDAALSYTEESDKQLLINAVLSSIDDIGDKLLLFPFGEEEVSNVQLPSKLTFNVGGKSMVASSSHDEGVIRVEFPTSTLIDTKLPATFICKLRK